MIYDDLVAELGDPHAEPQRRELLEPRISNWTVQQNVGLEKTA